MADPLGSQPFSNAWVLASIAIYTLLEIAIALLISPLLLGGALASPMLAMRLDILMHLASFYVGGLLVGVLSPRIRMVEPAVAAFISVLLVFMTSFFMPMRTVPHTLSYAFIGGGIAFALALMGAYTGERWMGNIGADGAPAKMRQRLWGPRGALSGGDARWASELEREKEKLRR